MQAAKDAGFDLTGKNMTLLGGGGAATAICVQAALDGLKEIHVFNIKDQFSHGFSLSSIKSTPEPTVKSP